MFEKFQLSCSDNRLGNFSEEGFAAREVFPSIIQTNLPLNTGRNDMFPYYCSRRDFAQKAKSRGGTLELTVEIYSQHARKNLDLFEQGLRGIGR